MRNLRTLTRMLQSTFYSLYQHWRLLTHSVGEICFWRASHSWQSSCFSLDSLSLFRKTARHTLVSLPLVSTSSAWFTLQALGQSRSLSVNTQSGKELISNWLFLNIIVLCRGIPFVHPRGWHVIHNGDWLVLQLCNFDHVPSHARNV